MQSEAGEDMSNRLSIMALSAATWAAALVGAGCGSPGSGAAEDAPVSQPDVHEDAVSAETSDADATDGTNEEVAACIPACTGRECGDDGCGKTCGACPAAAPVCSDGTCVAKCTPDCGGKECGDDGCGKTCGTCPAAAPVCSDGACVTKCAPDCTGKECGDDGCGKPCGTCPSAAPVCSDGTCVTKCTPNCTDKECGDDGCGKTCGTCPSAAPVCAEGTCVAKCTPNCAGKKCGDDGCGKTCGACPSAAPVCSDGTCVTKCTPNCTDKECGTNGCGGDCGSCSGTATCIAGTCVAGCQDECSGPACESGKQVGCVKGSNGCWQKAAPVSCDDGNVCTDDTCKVGACSSSPASGASCGPINSCSQGVCVVDPKKQPSVTITGHRLAKWSNTNPTLFGFLHHLYGKPLGTSTANNVLELAVSNPGGASVQVVVEVKIVGYSDTWSKSVQVDAGKSVPVNVPALELNAAWAALSAKVSPQLQVQLLQNGQVAYSTALPLDLHPRNSVYWGDIPGFEVEFAGWDAVVTLSTPGNPAIGELTASAKDYSAFGSILGYQCTTGYAWGYGPLAALTASVAPGKAVFWATWYKKGDKVNLSVAVTCSACWSYNAEYWIEDGDGAVVFSKDTLGSVSQEVTIPDDGWYYHYAKNPSSNSSNRAFTIMREVAASECAEDQLSALYLALQAKGFGYTSVGSGFFTAVQYVKPIEKTWKDKAGNCIDGTLLFAAALEAMGMEPLLVFPPGHALVAVRCAKGAPCVVPIETTAIGSGKSAPDAVQAGIASYGEAEHITEVKAMREFGFAPLP